MKPNDLPELPIDVKQAVNDGLHSLYEIDGVPGVKYALVTGAREVFPLSAVGAVVTDVKLIASELKPIRAVHFEGLSTRGGIVQLNYAAR